MAGIIHKIEEKLGMGGHKEGEKHDDHKAGVCEVEHIKPEHGHDQKKPEHKPEHGCGEHKEGLVDKIKDKIHGEGGHEEKKKKNKEKKKKHEHGYEHGDSSSSSDSD